MKILKFQKDGHYLQPLVSDCIKFQQNPSKGYWDTAGHTFDSEMTESKLEKQLFCH